MTKKELENILRQKQYDLLSKKILENPPQATRKLMGFLYHPEEEIRNAAAKGFGLSASILPMEKLKDLIRRMMWMLNDESGSCCWHVPLAIGEIGRANFNAIEGFIDQLEYYANDPDTTLSTGVKKALEMIRESQKI